MGNGTVKLPSAVIRGLATRAKIAAELDAEIKIKTAHLGQLREEIREMVAEYADRVPMVGSSRVIPLSTVGKSLRVTYTTGTPGMDYDALRAKVGEGNFLSITHPTAWELDVDSVNFAIERELFTESDLQSCLTDPPARKPSVYVDDLKGAEV
jgi:hypothetical protein